MNIQMHACFNNTNMLNLITADIGKNQMLGHVVLLESSPILCHYKTRAAFNKCRWNSSHELDLCRFQVFQKSKFKP